MFIEFGFPVDLLQGLITKATFLATVSLHVQNNQS
jgi:hypothetical protein